MHTTCNGYRFAVVIVIALIFTVHCPAWALARSLRPSITIRVVSVVGVPAGQIHLIRKAIERSLTLNGLSDPTGGDRKYSLTLIAESGEFNNGQTQIVLIWEIRTSERILGTLVQRNVLPADMDTWREVEEQAVPAAIPAIHKLVR